MSPIKGQIFKYSKEDVEAALTGVRWGNAVATDAAPRITLPFKAKSNTPR